MEYCESPVTLGLERQGKQEDDDIENPYFGVSGASEG